MKRNHIQALAVVLTLGCALQVAALAGRELPAGSTESVEAIKAIEPLTFVAPPLKKWHLDGGVSVGAFYNDNIFIGSSRKEGDFVFTISPSVSFTLGAPNSDGAGFVTLNYAPGFAEYLEHSSENSITQSAQLATGYRFTRLSLGLSLGYHQGREDDTEVGTRVDRRNFSAGFTSRYELTDRSSADLNLSTSLSDYDGFLDVSDLMVQSYFNTRVAEAFTLGLGVACGTAKAEASAAQTYEQVTLRASYTATEQLTFSGNFGVELRDSGDGSKASPIFGVTATYQPFDSTSISLSGSRHILPSAVVAQEDKEATSLFLAVRQRFLQQYYLATSVGYDHTAFQSTEGGSESRSDDLLSFGLSATTNLTERLSVQLYYQYRRNVSTAGTFGFSNQQIGVSSSLSF